MKGWRQLLILLGIGLAALSDQVLADTRVALVIGNGAYQNAPALPNPPRDAKAIAEAMDRLGFEVIAGYDQTKEGMVRLFRQFGRAAEKADVAVVFYAGHGIQVAGRNYLIPVDAKLGREQDLTYETLAVDTALDEAAAARRLRLVILDACRDNPFTARMSRSMGTRAFSVGRGFARIEDVPSDTLIAFATKADAVAEDGTGEHSPYTTALLQDLGTPGLSVERMFGRVRDSVMKATDGRQQPFTYGSLGAEAFYFNPTAAAQAGSETPPGPPASQVPATASPPVAPQVLIDREALFWHSIEASRNPSDLEAYLAQFPNGLYAVLARNRIKELTAAPPVTAQTPSPGEIYAPPEPPPDAPVTQRVNPLAPQSPVPTYSMSPVPSTLPRSHPGRYLPGRYPEASLRLLDRGELTGLPCRELRVARNEIFARHGYIFKTAAMRGYFERQPWYRAERDDVERLLSDVERRNIQTIQAEERICRD
jgi:hypothetical protein